METRCDMVDVAPDLQPDAPTDAADVLPPDPQVCTPCSTDADCDPGARCYRHLPGGEPRWCFPECDQDHPCPDNSSCTPSDGIRSTPGVAVCVPETPACCFGAGCMNECADQPGRPYVDVTGMCVECLADANCPVSRPICQDGQCVAGCPPWAPHSYLDQCLECTNDDAQCPCGVCGSGRCWYRAPEATCACVAPYPFCIILQGQITCVACFADTDCPYGCSCKDYNCVDPGVGWCEQQPAGCHGACDTAGCPDPEGHWTGLQCDPVGQCCVSPDARCDGRAAFCTKEGSRCQSLRDAFGGSFAAWLEGEPACDRFAKGYCTCDLAAQAECGSGVPGTDVGCCPVGQRCISDAELFRRLVGDVAATPPPGVGWTAFCVDETLAIRRK